MKHAGIMAAILLTSVLAGTGVQAASVSEKDNFYAAVNQKTLATQKIPPTESLWSQFSQKNLDNQNMITHDITEIVAKQGSFKKGTPEQKTADLYQCIMDQETRNRLSPKIIHGILAPVEKAGTTSELNQALIDIYNHYGITVLLGFSVARMPSSPLYTVRIEPAVPKLAQNALEREVKPGAWQEYKQYITDILVWDGQKKEDAAQHADAIFAWEQKMAPYQLTGVQRNSSSYTSRTVSADEFKKETKNLQGNLWLKAWNVEKEKAIIHADNAYLVQWDKDYTDQNLSLFKNYVLFRLTAVMAPYASMDIANRSMDFDNSLSGIKARYSDKEWANKALQGMLSYELGDMYNHHYCTAEKVADMQKMVNTLRSIHRNRLVHNTWMSEKTRQQAIEKLDAMRVFIGGPALDDQPVVQNISEVVPESAGGSFLSNMLLNQMLRNKQSLNLVGTKFNPDKWDPNTPAYEASASYDPFSNSIIIPAGVLQPPFYDPKADYGTNLGGIGVIIGHEISHAFDNNGCLYDKNGLMKNWWTKEDAATFQKKAEKFYPYYSNYPLGNGLHLNGRLVVSEAIADCGGLSVVTEAVHGDKQALRNLYRNFATCFWDLMTPEFLVYVLNNDPHPVGAARVNCALSTTPGFYDAYNIQKGDGMYVAPEKRVAVW